MVTVKRIHTHVFLDGQENNKVKFEFTLTKGMTFGEHNKNTSFIIIGNQHFIIDVPFEELKNIHESLNK